MKVFQIEKKMCSEFLLDAMKEFEVIAPVKKDLVRFEKINSPDNICLEQMPYFPVKEFFFKKHEVILKFDGKKFTAPAVVTTKKIFYGMRKCDLNGIHRQDLVFIHDAHDPYYTAERENSFLIGYHCDEAPSEYCFCGSMQLIDFYDLMCYDKGEHYLVEVGSEKGDLLIEKFGKFFTSSNRLITPDEKKIKGADRLKVKNLNQLYEHPDWKKGVDLCLSCAACTNLCPTCYCFSFYDEISTKNTSESERKRDWSSCQLPEFTRVAGDHVFRKDREQRFKHRIYHQLEYFREKYGVDLCVGCGRCISGCPTRIDFVNIINEMK